MGISVLMPAILVVAGAYLGLRNVDHRSSVSEAITLGQGSVTQAGGVIGQQAPLIQPISPGPRAVAVAVGTPSTLPSTTTDVADRSMSTPTESTTTSPAQTVPSQKQTTTTQGATTTLQDETTTTIKKETTTTQAGTTSTRAETTTTQGKHASGPVVVSGESGVTIENLAISNPGGPCIQILGSSRVTIKDSTIGPCGDWAVFIDKSSDVTVQNTIIRTEASKGGVYGHSSSSIAVLGNSIFDSGRNPVQFDKVTGSGNRIEYNLIEGNAAEDMISVYMSGGTSGSWLMVRENTVKDNVGQSNSGSGILVGDSGGSYIVVQDNTLRDPGQAGIGVAGGSNIKVLDNSITSRQLPWSNVGIYVWDQYNSNCHNIEVRGNSVDWINKDGYSNPAYNGGGCGDIAGWNNNSW